ncbi:MAG: ribose transport system permease protein [Candidatus Eremiobacteraeota bacterium]|jgi:ribose transport system permease protein|nr:ribose transport system permease protein [Candidatus Eremiobacteraeota bacterium]
MAGDKVPQAAEKAQVTAEMAARADDAAAKNRRAATIRTTAIVVGFIALLYVVNVLAHGDLLRPGNITNVLRQITVNAIMAVGQTFVIITAGIDLSVGSLIALTGVVMAQIANALPFSGAGNFAVTLLVGLAVGCAAGYVNALPVVRLGLPPFITTLAMMQVARGLAFILAHGQPIPLKNSAPFDWLGTGYLFPGLLGLPGIPYAVLVMAVVVIVFFVLLARTAYGRYVLALGGNEEAARLAGVDTVRVKTLVYVISGGCAAVAGLLLMSRFASGAPQNGTGYELQAIAAVVVGGTSLMGGRGTIVGTFFGALLIGVLNNVMNLLHVESYTQLIVLGVVILLAVVLDELRKRYLAAR